MKSYHLEGILVQLVGAKSAWQRLGFQLMIELNVENGWKNYRGVKIDVKDVE